MKNSYLAIIIVIIIWLTLVFSAISETFPTNKALAVMARTNGVVYTPTNFISANNLMTNGQTIEIEKVVGLQDALDSKLATNGVIEKYQVNGLTNDLASLETNIASKLATNGIIQQYQVVDLTNDLANLQSDIATKANTNHNHNLFEIVEVSPTGSIPFADPEGFLTNSESLIFSYTNLIFGNNDGSRKTFVINGGTDQIEEIIFKDDNTDKLWIKNDQSIPAAEIWSQSTMTITSQNDVVLSPNGNTKIPSLEANKAIVVNQGGALASAQYGYVFQDGSATNVVISAFSNLLDAASQTLPLIASANGTPFFKISNVAGDDAPCEVSFGLGNEINNRGTAFGTFAIANENGVAIGCNVTGSTNSVGVGKDVQAQNDSIGVGYQPIANRSSISIGSSARSDTNSITIGNFSTSHQTNAIAIGNSAFAAGEGRVQLGQGTNSNNNTLQFRSVRIADTNGLNTFGSGRIMNLVVKTNSYTLQERDHVVVFNSPSDCTGLLTAPITLGKEYIIVNKGLGFLTVKSTTNINNFTDVELEQSMAMHVVADGEIWVITATCSGKP